MDWKLNDKAIFDCKKDGYPKCQIVGALGGPLLSVIFEGMEDMGAVPVLRCSLKPLDWKPKPEEPEDSPEVVQRAMDLRWKDTSQEAREVYLRDARAASAAVGKTP